MYVIFRCITLVSNQNAHSNTGTDNAENAAMCVALGYDNISATDNLSEKLEYIMKKTGTQILKLIKKLFLIYL